MAGFLNNDVYDSGLSELADGNELHICSAMPTTYTEAIVTYTLGVKTTPTISAPGAKAGGGREVTISAITDGAVTGTDTAAYFAIVDTTTSRLLAAQALGTPQVVTSGNVFTTTALKIGIASPA